MLLSYHCGGLFNIYMIHYQGLEFDVFYAPDHSFVVPSFMGTANSVTPGEMYLHSPLSLLADFIPLVRKLHVWCTFLVIWSVQSEQPCGDADSPALIKDSAKYLYRVDSPVEWYCLRCWISEPYVWVSASIYTFTVGFWLAHLSNELGYFYFFTFVYVKIFMQTNHYIIITNF